MIILLRIKYLKTYSVDTRSLALTSRRNQFSETQRDSAENSILCHFRHGIVKWRIIASLWCRCHMEIAECVATVTTRRFMKTTRAFEILHCTYRRIILISSTIVNSIFYRYCLVKKIKSNYSRTYRSCWRITDDLTNDSVSTWTNYNKVIRINKIRSKKVEKV